MAAARRSSRESENSWNAENAASSWPRTRLLTTTPSYSVGGGSSGCSVAASLAMPPSRTMTCPDGVTAMLPSRSARRMGSPTGSAERVSASMARTLSDTSLLPSCFTSSASAARALAARQTWQATAAPPTAPAVLLSYGNAIGTPLLPRGSARKTLRPCDKNVGHGRSPAAALRVHPHLPTRIEPRPGSNRARPTRQGAGSLQPSIGRAASRASCLEPIKRSASSRCPERTGSRAGRGWWSWSSTPR